MCEILRVHTLAAEDKGILAVVFVVLFAQAHVLKAQGRIQALGDFVAPAHLQRGVHHAQVGGVLQQRLGQRPADAPAPAGLRHGDVGDVGLVQHDPRPGEADDLPRFLRYQVARAGVLGHFLHEVLPAPGLGERRRFNGVHAVHVCQGHPADGVNRA